jgi:hypothetical protein
MKSAVWTGFAIFESVVNEVRERYKVAARNVKVRRIHTLGRVDLEDISGLGPTPLAGLPSRALRRVTSARRPA